MLIRRVFLSSLVALPMGGRAAPSSLEQQLFKTIELDQGHFVLKLLLDGVDPNAVGPQGQRPLHWALMHEAGKAVDALLADPRTQVESENDAGERPMMLAALRGRMEWVKALHRRGAHVEPKRGQKAWGALHYACSGPDEGVSAWLLAQGADPNARSENGTTPLMMAMGYGRIDSAAVLLKHGADGQAVNDLGLGAWEFAKRAGRPEAAEKLGLKPTTVSDKT